MNQLKQAIIAKFDQLPANSKEFVMVCMTAIIDRNPTPLRQLRGIHSGNPELCAVIDEAIQHIGRNLPRYIIETPNQLWGGYSWDNTYPVTLQDGSSHHAKLHVFDDLAIAKQVQSSLSRERGGEKLKIYQLADDGKRVEVSA